VKAFYFRNTGGISPAVLAGLVPITVGGIGTWDSAFVILLTGHLTTEGATLVALGCTVLAYWLIGLLGVPVALREIVAFLRNRPGNIDAWGEDSRRSPE